MSESLTVWKFECLKVWMWENLDVWKFYCVSESLNVWKFDCLKVWMSESLDVRKSGCLKIWWNVWKFESLKVWMSESLDVWKFECLKVWMSESLNVWKFECLKVWMSESLDVWKFECLKVWMSGSLNVSKFECLKVWMSGSLNVFVFKVWTVGMWRNSRTKASFSKLEHLEFQRSLARNAFLRDSECTKLCILQDKTCLGWCVGKLVRRTVSEHARFYRDHGRIGREVELPVQASLSRLQPLKIWRKSRTKASFLSLEHLEFEGSLERKLRFHIFNCSKLKEVYCV